MTHSVVNIDHLKQQVLPELFAFPARLGEYGGVADSSAKIDQLSDLMESGSAAALAAKIAEILSKMADASPEQITRKPTWFEKVLGGAVEKQVRYQVARSTLEQLLAEAEGHAQGVRDTVSAISRMIIAHAEEAEALKVFIQAGREFLEENPLIGTVAEGEIEFDRPREQHRQSALAEANDWKRNSFWALLLAGLFGVIATGHESIAQIIFRRVRRIGELLTPLR